MVTDQSDSVDERSEGRLLTPEERFFDLAVDMLCVLGFTPAEMMSRPFIEFVHPDDRERTQAQNVDVRVGGQALSFENRYLCKDGTYKWLLWNATSEPGEGAIYAVARDITARKRAEEERERLVQELQTALAEVRTLQEILPICSYCRKIRDDENYWDSVEGYVARHTDARFSHSICPDCYATEVEPQLAGLDG